MEPECDILGVNSVDNALLVCLANCQRERPDDSTCRPFFDPKRDCGSKFTPLEVPDREFWVQELPSTPLALFHIFLPISLVDKWVKYTNEGPTRGPEGPPTRRSRQHLWTPTSTSEVFLWIATLIYMGIHREMRYEDHWKTGVPENLRPRHPILQFMTYDRFTQLQTHIRLVSPDHNVNTSIQHLKPSSPYYRVEEWSQIIQEGSLLLYKPGIYIAVDECMIGYLGRSLETVTIPTKPTPTGFKVWAVAQQGYFLRWLWHSPKQAFGPVGVQPSRKRKRSSENDLPPLNPTQSVVVALVKLLPKATYHVYLDNLFSSPSLFTVLRKQGIAATGTCRSNCGFFEPFVKAKAEDKKGKCWPWGTLKTAPTPDGQVRALIDTFTSIIPY